MKSNELYNITIEGGEIYTGLSEDAFLDKIVELSQCYYDTGYPHPNLISHSTYNGKDSSILDRDQDSNDSKEDSTGTR
tara:strand:- start:349 stop:582 length:234 start_codon:yes stop_codon:yes gene_type:complete